MTIIQFSSISMEVSFGKDETIPSRSLNRDSVFICSESVIFNLECGDNLHQ